jgi:hypothetical protein
MVPAEARKGVTDMSSAKKTEGGNGDSAFEKMKGKEYEKVLANLHVEQISPRAPRYIH